jgi:hypothetical protein
MIGRLPAAIIFVPSDAVSAQLPKGVRYQPDRQWTLLKTRTDRHGLPQRVGLGLRGLALRIVPKRARQNDSRV